MARTVNIEVYCDVDEEGEREVFAVASEHRADFPPVFEKLLQKWAQENFDHLELGDSIEEAGEMVYKPNGPIHEFRLK